MPLEPGKQRSRRDCVCSVTVRLGRLAYCYMLNVVITDADIEEIDRVKSHLVASFIVKDLGDLHYFIGIKVIQTPEGISINQHYSVLNMFFNFNTTNYKVVMTPLDRKVKLRLIGVDL